MMNYSRPSITRLLPHQAIVERAIKRKSGPGGWITEWKPINTELKCRFSIYTPKNLKTSEEQRRSFPTSHLVITQGEEDILEGDRLVFKGKTYEVVSPPQDPSFAGHHLEIEVRLLTKEELKGK